MTFDGLPKARFRVSKRVLCETDADGPTTTVAADAWQARVMANQLYMIVEHFKDNDPLPVYRRFRDKGRDGPRKVSITFRVG